LASQRKGHVRTPTKRERRRLAAFGTSSVASLQDGLHSLFKDDYSAALYHLRHASPVSNDGLLNDLGACVSSSPSRFATFLMAHLPDEHCALYGDGMLDSGRALFQLSPSDIAQLYVYYRNSSSLVYEVMMACFRAYHRQVLLASRLKVRMRQTCVASTDKSAASTDKSARDTLLVYESVVRDQYRLMYEHPMALWALEIGRASDDYRDLTEMEWLMLTPLEPDRIPQQLNALLCARCVSTEAKAYILSSIMETWLAYGADCTPLVRHASAFLPFSALIASVMFDDIWSNMGLSSDVATAIWSQIRRSDAQDVESGELHHHQSLIAYLIMNDTETWRAAIPVASVDVTLRALFPHERERMQVISALSV